MKTAYRKPGTAPDITMCSRTSPRSSLTKSASSGIRSTAAGVPVSVQAVVPARRLRNFQTTSSPARCAPGQQPWLRLDAHQLQVIVLEPHLSAVNIIPDTARVNQLESEYVISGTETVAGDASNEAVA